MTRYTPEELRLIEVWGTCPVCGAPRENVRIIETHLDGKTTTIDRLSCSADPVNHYQP